MHLFVRLRFLNWTSRKSCKVSARNSKKQLLSVDGDESPPPSLESLPPEIISLILKFMPNIRALRSLVFACPHVHRCYVTQRESVLLTVLTQELPAQIQLTLVACLKAPNVTAQQTLNSTYEKFMDRYPVFKSPFENSALAALSTEIVSAARLHNIVTDCVQDFATSCAHSCGFPIDAPGPHRPLSPTEKYRLFRAFYRYELFIRLFSDAENLTKIQQLDNVFRWQSFDEMQSYFSSYPPWEVEETSCIFDYLVYKYHVIMSDIDRKNLSGKSHWPRWATSNDDKNRISVSITTSHTEFDSLASLGLEFFRTITYSRTLHEQRNTISYIQESLFADKYSFHIRWIREQLTLSRPGPEAGIELWPEEGSPLTFGGDEDGKPNAAWVSAHGNKMSHEFYEPCFAGLRRWGYPMWDKKRLDRIDAKLLAAESRPKKGWQRPMPRSAQSSETITPGTSQIDKPSVWFPTTIEALEHS